MLLVCACDGAHIRHRPVQLGVPVSRPDVEFRILSDDGAGAWSESKRMPLRFLESRVAACGSEDELNACTVRYVFARLPQEGAPEPAEAQKAELTVTVPWENLPRLSTGQVYLVSYGVGGQQASAVTLDLRIQDREGRELYVIHSGPEAKDAAPEGWTFDASKTARYFTSFQHGMECRIRRLHRFTQTSSAGSEEVCILAPGESCVLQPASVPTYVRVFDNSASVGGDCPEELNAEHSHFSYVMYPVKGKRD